MGAYSHAILAGNPAYVAGQIPLDPKTGELVTDASIEGQTRQVLENLRVVLEASDMSLDDVVATQVFVTDIGEAARVNAVYASYFKQRPPARALVQVARLPRDVRIEITATAVK